ncbi:MAG TPA: HAD-IA family hydrolase [Gaiellaceae bacterium]|nr:HAD-IA family hydrolase [Gaiellaceae bacterium]
MRFAEVDAVTVDGFGTLLTLVDPVPGLAGSLAARGVDREPELVRTAFAAEVAYYRPEALRGRDAESLAALRRDCTGVFLRAAGAELDAASFVDDFMASIRFEPLPGALETLASLRRRGIDLAVVSNWDVGLHEHLAGLGLDRLVDAVVTSAEAGAPKPDPRIWRLALERLGTERAVHVGDSDADAEGARAAGLRFEAAPLAEAAERILAA